MRTTISLDDQLLREAKAVAAENGKTLTELVSDSLRESLARRRQASSTPRVKLKTFKGTGLRPGVDINNSAELLDLMDEYDSRS